MKNEEKKQPAFGPEFQKSIGALHRKTADRLNQACKKLSPQMLISFFILFCLMAGLYFISLIFGILN